MPNQEQVRNIFSDWTINTQPPTTTTIIMLEVSIPLYQSWPGFVTYWELNSGFNLPSLSHWFIYSLLFDAGSLETICSESISITIAVERKGKA